MLVNDLQLEVDHDGRVLYVWGLCPQESWMAGKVERPTAKPGVLRYVGGTIVPGVSKQLNQQGRWPMVHDRANALICVGSGSSLGELIAFAPGVIAALQDNQLTALWLRLDSMV